MKAKINSANGSIWIEKNGIKFFGKGPLELLEGIEKTGSINEAAKMMELSYKKAWTIIQRINEVSGSEMVITKAGGNKGGGAIITPSAKELMNQYRKMTLNFHSFLEKESKQL